jgi:putative transposase
MGSEVIFRGQSTIVLARRGIAVANPFDMPRARRPSSSGLVFHVLNRSAKRVPLFESASDYDAFERVLRKAVKRSAVSLFAYCIMPNHWHLIVRADADRALARALHWLETTHARRWQIARQLDGQGAVYQARYRSIAVACDRHFLWVCRYVERNALRANLVGRAEDWRWSSVWLRIHHPDDDLLTAWPLAAPKDWIADLNQPQTDAELDAIRGAVRDGQPFGDEEWASAVRTAAGVREPRRPGRPRRQPAGHCPPKMTSDPITDLCS